MMSSRHLALIEQRWDRGEFEEPMPGADDAARRGRGSHTNAVVHIRDHNPGSMSPSRVLPRTQRLGTNYERAIIAAWRPIIVGTDKVASLSP